MLGRSDLFFSSGDIVLSLSDLFVGLRKKEFCGLFSRKSEKCLCVRD